MRDSGRDLGGGGRGGPSERRDIRLPARSRVEYISSSRGPENLYNQLGFKTYVDFINPN